MEEKEVILTQEGYDNLEKELKSGKLQNLYLSKRFGHGSE